MFPTFPAQYTSDSKNIRELEGQTGTLASDNQSFSLFTTNTAFLPVLGLTEEENEL